MKSINQLQLLYFNLDWGKSKIPSNIDCHYNRIGFLIENNHSYTNSKIHEKYLYMENYQHIYNVRPC